MQPAETPETSTAPITTPNGLSEWSQWLGEQELPVFSNTVKALTSSMEGSEQSATDVAHVILQDAALTARILRLASSSYYNPSGQPVNTVTRAVIRLGSGTLRSLCLSCALIETLENSTNASQNLIREIALAMHAAVQAKALAETSAHKAPESVFISTLLQRMGQIAFWALGGETAERLYRSGSAGTVEAEIDILGFSLQQLGENLCRQWNLDELAKSPGGDSAQEEQAQRWVKMGRRIAEAVEQGWDNPDLEPLTESLARQLDLEVDEAREFMQANTRITASIIDQYEASQALTLIPAPPGDCAAEPAAADNTQPVINFPEPDPMLQLQILRDISDLLNATPDLSTLLEMVLEGIYRGIGLDRAVLALVSRDRRTLQARASLGWDEQENARPFVIDLAGNPSSLFQHVIDSGEPLWLPDKPPAEMRKLLSLSVRGLIGETSCFLMPVVAAGKSIGLFYADRAPSGRPLDENAFTSFKHFSLQANVGLALINRNAADKTP